MDRIDAIDPERMTAAQRRIFDRIAAPPRGRVAGPFRVWLHRPELTEHIESLGRHLRFDCGLPARLRELAVLVTARCWGASYEWHAHEPHALKAGLAQSTVAAIAERRRPDFVEADESAVYDLCSELHTTHDVAEETYRRAVAELSQDGVIELVALVGYYALVAMTLNAFRVPLPDGAPDPFAD